MTAVAIVADARVDRGSDAQPRQPGSYVGGKTARVLAEGPDILERDLVLLGVKVEPDATGDQRLDHHSTK